eukprot:Nk52_evm13s136 gene=Nk52_evmTU13s136
MMGELSSLLAKDKNLLCLTGAVSLPRKKVIMNIGWKILLVLIVLFLAFVKGERTDNPYNHLNNLNEMVKSMPARDKRSTSSSAIQLPIGFILPLSTEVTVGEDIFVALEIAKHDITNSILDPARTQLVFSPRDQYVRDDESRELVGLRHATDLMHIRDVFALIGAWNSAVSAQVATYAASVGIVQISGASVAPSLSQKKNYPSFVRTVPTSDLTMLFQLKVCQLLKWTRVSVLTTDDLFGFSAAKTFRDNGPEYGVTISTFDTVPFNIKFLEAHSLVRESLAKIKVSGTRVIFFSGIANDAIEVLTEAKSMGMIGGNYQWLGGDGWVFDMIEQLDFAEELIGSIGCTSFTNTTTSAYQNYITRFQSTYRDMYNTTKTVPEFFTIGHYDAMLLLAKGLNATIARLDSLSISIDCLQYSKRLTPACALPNAERDSIYQDALENKYMGVVELQQLLPTPGSKLTTVAGASVLYGAYASSTQVMLLQEIYRTSFQGVGGLMQLTEQGDIDGEFAIMNYQAVDQSNKKSNFDTSAGSGAGAGKAGVTTLKWVITGVGRVGNNNQSSEIDFSLFNKTLMFSGSTPTVPLTDASIFANPLTIDNCDLADDKKYSLFENTSYAMDKYQSEIILIVVFALLITTSSVCGFIYSIILIRSSRNLARQASDNMYPPAEVSAENGRTHTSMGSTHQSFGSTIYYAVVSNNSNNAVIVIIAVEYIFILFVSLQPDLSWLDSSGSEGILKSMLNFSVGSFLYYLNYVWIAVLFLWCIYCLIYMLRLSHHVSQYYLGEMFLYPSIFYLRVVGTVGLLPIVTSLLRLFNCKYIDVLDAAVLARPYCEQECFTSTHKSLLILSGVLLIIFTPLNLMTAHIWQELTNIKVKEDEAALKFRKRVSQANATRGHDTALCLSFAREHILLNQIVFLLLVSSIAFLKLYPYYFLGVTIFLLITRVSFHLFAWQDGQAANVLWVNYLIHAQAIAGIGSAVICLVAHAGDVSGIWPFFLVVGWGIFVIVATILLAKKKYKKHGVQFYEESMEKKLANKNSRDKHQLSQLVFEITGGTGSNGNFVNTGNSDDDKLIEESISIEKSAFNTVQERHGKQLALATESFNDYCSTIDAHSKDIRFLREILTAGLNFSNTLMKTNEKAIEAHMDYNNEDCEENKELIKAFNEGTHAAAYQFLSAVAAESSRQGLRFRTTFLRKTNPDIVKDRDMNRQLMYTKHVKHVLQPHSRKKRSIFSNGLVHPESDPQDTGSHSLSNRLSAFEDEFIVDLEDKTALNIDQSVTSKAPSENISEITSTVSGDITVESAKNSGRTSPSE